MYTRLDVVADAEARSESVAFQDRMRYKAFFEAAERFAAENGLIVGGESATRLLLGDPADPEAPPPITRASFQYDFYSSRAAPAANALKDAMHAVDPEGLGHYATVLPRIPGYHVIVAVDGRSLFTVTALPVHRGVKTADVVIPSHRPSQFARGPGGEPLRLACMGPEIQLMRIYATLCNPGAAGEWEDMLAAEVSLRAMFSREIKAKIAEAVARTEGSRGGRGDRGGARAQLRAALYGRFAAGPDRVLIGPAALALLRGEPLGDERLQTVTVAPLEDEAQEIAALMKLHGFEAQWSVHDSKIPTDPRMRRLTVSLVEGRGGRREPFIDVYNAAAHELVPYVVASALPGARRSRGAQPPAALKVGTPFVIMRFRLADMWTMQILMHMGAANVAYTKSVLHGMLKDYEACAAHYGALQARAARDVDAAAALLPLSSYVGRLEDPALALRRAALDRPGPRFRAARAPPANDSATEDST